jgi:hypothetical protein
VITGICNHLSWDWKAVYVNDNDSEAAIVIATCVHDAAVPHQLKGYTATLFNGALLDKKTACRIAAVPDLYAIAKEILADAEADTGLRADQIARLSVAVAKAEGRQ